MTSRSEKSILNETVVEVSALPGTMCWRNNTGQAWAGKRARFYPGTTTPVPPGVVVLTNARPVSFGLPGSSDILGASQGVPLAIETKAAAGRQDEQQELFQAAWEKAGGLYVLARTPDEAVASIIARP